MAHIRRNVHGLGGGWNDTLLWYAQGIRTLQARPLTDPTSWRFLAAMHGVHPVVWEAFGIIQPGDPLPSTAVQRRYWLQCQHQTWYFLPWHRGYLAAFEAIVRAVVVAQGGPNDWALPYWNYSDSAQPNARRLPEAFAAATLPDGSANPLRVDRRFGNGTNPLELDPLDVGLAALEHDAFKGGDNDIPPGFGGPETSFHHGPESDTTNGGLEAEPHNLLHGAIGGVIPGTDPRNWRNLGLMSMPITAGLDPVFWLHHANIDRLWSVWRSMPGHSDPTEAGWLSGPPDRQFVMPRIDGSEWVFSAQDVLDTTAAPLAYSYEEDTAPTVERRLNRRLRGLGLRAAAAAETTEAGVSAGRSSELIGASEGAVRVHGRTGASVRIDSAASGVLRTSLSRATTGATPAAEPARVFLKLEGMRSSSDAAIYRVYVDLPPSADPADYLDRLAGSVSLFGVSAATDPEGPVAGSGINQVFEITKIVDALHLSGDELAKLEVQFVPANAQLADAEFSVERVSVHKLGD